ncbi:sigma-54-dependent transcriptional regulator [Rhizosphaericola mali]|uniref:Sigma-54-dependent Fis family transcriptional regulator n=1 Tax=Rhizosphaericola mali TaxID=2545455 RepID=A0A5P2G734_9BACT|nr:sigma-54 dependent transcriptional regulator [Rhizosphaericola mali]QES90079.1 sigma-54-dependent Fis family transcriptional regulator [Rhizosphaericola mali]
MKKNTQTILIVEDEFIVANDLRMMVEAAGYSVLAIAASYMQAKNALAIERPDWVLLDIMLLSPETGIDLAKDLQLLQIPFIYISANTNQQTFELAKLTRPFGFLVKPFREKNLLLMLEIAQNRLEVEKELNQRKQTLISVSTDQIIGRAPKLLDVLNKVQLVAPTNSSVLITGDSGTGKERIAKMIHDVSKRKNHSLVTVNCGALPQNLVESELFGHERGAFTGAMQRRLGKFEQAHQSTIFLDEIGELSLDAQVKLLRVLQENEIERVGGSKIIPIDVRVIAATNRDLEIEVAAGRFRLDLYYRLHVFPIELPPLRERKDDIPLLVAHFLEKFSHGFQLPAPAISNNAIQKLIDYHWPGNIRELEHLIERYFVLYSGKSITEFTLPKNETIDNVTQVPLNSLEDVERDHILKALQQTEGRVSGINGAASLLKITAQTLYTKIKKLGIKSGYK